MALRLVGRVDLPAHAGPGGFDHAAIDRRTQRLYVAHTANDAVDVIDSARDVHVGSLGGLTAVAGALVAEYRRLAFTSNRGEDSVSVFALEGDDARPLARVAVGVRPNGLAFDPARGTLVAANVGDPARPGSFTLTVVDAAAGAVRGSIPVPGRTRWAVHDPATDCFFVNIADPAVIVVVAAGDPTRVAATYPVPAAGPHGLDLDPGRGRLYCACDAGRLVALEAKTGRVLDEVALSGAPDVIFLDAGRERLYVAVGDPGVIDVIDTGAMTQVERVATEPGAHTTALDVDRRRLYVFLPESHRAAVFVDD